MKHCHIVLVILTAACSPTKGGTDGETGTGTGDSSGSGGSTTGEPTTGPVDPGEFGEMEACALDPVCEPFEHPLGEGEPYHSSPSDGFLPVEECILGGLRDGTPGRYVYGTSDNFTNGNDTQTYLIHVHADRAVTFALHSKGFTFPPDALYETYKPAETCTLADAKVFADCLADKDNGDHYECMDVKLWWTDCAAMGPRCE